MAQEPNYSQSRSQYCATCGTSLEPGGRFCPSCGAATEGAGAPAPYTTDTPAEYAGHPFRWSNALNPNGRFGRLEFLLFLVIPYLIALVLLARFPPVGLVWIIMVIYIVIVAYIRRFHDLNHSGWFTLLGLVPIVSLLVIIYLLFFPGTRGPNRYGN